MFKSKRAIIFLAASIITILFEVFVRICNNWQNDYEKESMVPVNRINKKITNFPLPETKTEKKEDFEYPRPLTTYSSKWDNYDRYDTTTFSYDPYVPHNEQNEDVLDGKDPQAELKAIFQQKYCKNGEIKFPDFNPASGPAPIHATKELNILSTLVYPQNRKCNPCQDDCEYTILNKKLLVEDFLVRQKDDMTEEVWMRLEQAWNRVFYGIKEIIFI